MLDEVLADPGVAAAFVAVDSPRHHPVGLRVLQADRHLMVEKPLALTVADAGELSGWRQTRRRVLAVGHLLLHHPAVRRARQLIADGELGETLWLEAARLAPGPAPRPRLGLVDAGAARRLAGAAPVRRRPHQRDRGRRRRSGAGRRDRRLGDAALRRRPAGAHPRGTPRGREEARILDRRDRARADLRRAAGRGRPPASRSGARRLGEPGEPVPVDVVDALGAQCRHFVASVARGDTAAGNGAHALAVVRVLEAGARSMRAGGAPVEVV